MSKVANFGFACHCSAPCAIYGLKVGMGTDVNVVDIMCMSTSL